MAARATPSSKDEHTPVTQARTERQQVPEPEPDDAETPRRTARRRPAAPPRERIAANDDVPSIGGLIYALNQRPSRKPFLYATIASVVWTALVLIYVIVALLPQETGNTGLAIIVTRPWFLTIMATWLCPLALFGFLAALIWRTEELHLRSSAMTEVAVRLAEPDRMAEQSVASLGQAVRRQVSFMNDAVSRALGRAGELEALVHNEVSSLEQSYEENERKIRGLIAELSGERSALMNTGHRFQHTLQSLGTEVPAIIERLNDQQQTLAQIIDGAATNLTNLESALGNRTGKLETTLTERTTHLHKVLEDYTGSLSDRLGQQSTQMQTMLTDYTAALGMAFDSRTKHMQGVLESSRGAIDTSLDTHTRAISDHSQSIASNLDAQREALDSQLTKHQGDVEEIIGDRTQMLQTVFEEYARALDTTLANRAQALDTQLVERTKALDEAFSERLRLFDEAILRSTMEIDNAVGENAKSLTSAMESHAHNISRSLTAESQKIDETLMAGINAVRSTSENVTQQSLKAIEGLAGQADMLRNVSENLLGQINSVTNRFENQGHAILRSANSLEHANQRIDVSLRKRTEDMNKTLDRMAGKADELGRVVEGYSSTLEGSLTTAEQRARMLTDELNRGAEERSRATIESLERVKYETSREADRALNELRAEFANVSEEVNERLSTLSSQFSETTGEVRQHAARAAQQLEDEQHRLRKQLDLLPTATTETSNAMRKALQDQLRALDQLTALANRTVNDKPPAALKARVLDGPRSGRTPSERADMSTLSSSLARELEARQTHPSTDQSPSDDAEQAKRWSLGDLLARASQEEKATAAVKDDPPAQPSQPEHAPPADRATSEDGLDIQALSAALDAAGAAAIWARFRNGQRGFMVRSIYAPDTRQMFDRIERRYRESPNFRANVDRFLVEFERGLYELDRKDPSRQSSDAQIVTDAGRVYLVLAHAAKRLA